MDELRYDATAATRLLDGSLDAMRERLEHARAEALQDVELLKSGGDIPESKQPLDAGFIRLPEELLAEFHERGPESQLGRIQSAAADLRSRLDRIVLLGIGGSYMGARALFEALCHPYHNELSRRDRNGVPRVSFAGNNLDSDAVTALLELLPGEDSDLAEVENRWGTVVVSKSGGTLETAVAFRLIRQAVESLYGAGTEECRQSIVPVTGETGLLRSITEEQQSPYHFPIPDGVGGRFSILTAVGLLPAALLGLDVEALLQGAADMTKRFESAPPGENPVLDYTAVCHGFERQGKVIRVLSTWGSRLEATGLWYDQLLSESLGKDNRGATPITVVNTRDLHSRGQQHQEGTLDKLITNLIVEQPSQPPVSIPQFDSDLDKLNRFASRSVNDVLHAAVQGTNQAYAAADRPTADIVLPKLTEYTLGQFLQMMMLATVVEGRLIGINPYGQPGVEAYKTNTMRILSEQS